MRGRTWRQKNTIASTLGAYVKLAVNTRLSGCTVCVEGVNSSGSTPFGITETCARGASRRSRAASTSDTARQWVKADRIRRSYPGSFSASVSVSACARPGRRPLCEPPREGRLDVVHVEHGGNAGQLHGKVRRVEHLDLDHIEVLACDQGVELGPKRGRGHDPPVVRGAGQQPRGMHAEGPGRFRDQHGHHRTAVRGEIRDVRALFLGVDRRQQRHLVTLRQPPQEVEISESGRRTKEGAAGTARRAARASAGGSGTGSRHRGARG